MADVISIKRLLEIAQNEVGYKEKASEANLDDKTANAGSSNYTKYSRDTAKAGYGNANGVAWCVIFVNWCFLQLAGGDKTKALEIQCQTGPNASCSASRNGYQHHKRYTTTNPMPGDQIFFQKSTGELKHTGIVCKVEAGRVYTIEGNYSQGVGTTSYSITDSSIAGYGRPKYDDASLSMLYDSNIPINIVTADSFFTMYAREVKPTSASIKVIIKKDTTFNWSYSLTNLLTKANPVEQKIKKMTDSISLSELTPHTMYALKVTAEDDTFTTTQQITFTTPYSYAGQVSNLIGYFDAANFSAKKCTLSFKPPTSWGTDCINKGYLTCLLLNGRVAKQHDSLITSISNSGTINITIALSDLIGTSDDFKLSYNDVIQIGVLPWKTCSDNKTLIDMDKIACTTPLLLRHIFDSIDKTFVGTDNGYKKCMLYIPLLETD